MRDFKINDNGTLRKAKEVWINTNGVLHKATEVWINSGELKQVFPLGFSKIRFTGNAWGLKGNYGTSAAYLKDSNGNSLWSRVGGSNYVCPTIGTSEYDIPVIDDDLPYKITLKRNIDTDGGGGASMRIKLLDNQTDEWVTVLYTTSYRTSDYPRTTTYNLSINQ